MHTEEVVSLSLFLEVRERRNSDPCPQEAEIAGSCLKILSK